MTKIIRNFSFIIILIFAITGCIQNTTEKAEETSVKQEEVSPSITRIDFLSENDKFILLEEQKFLMIQSEAYSLLQIDYSLKGGVPGELYIVSVELDFSDAYFQNLNQYSVALKIDNPQDINDQLIIDNIHKDKNSCKIQRVIQWNNSSEILFSIFVGSETNRIKGNILLENPYICSIDEVPEYKVALLDEIRFVFLEEDLDNRGYDEEDIYTLLENMNKFRKSMRMFTDNYEPCYGITTYVFTEFLPCTGLSGEPIYINRKELDSLFSEIFGNKHILTERSMYTVLCHEMSHTFDMMPFSNETAGFCFDREFFAVLKTIYVLSENGFILEENFLPTSPGLNSGIYNYKVFLKLFMDKLDLWNYNNENWDVIKYIMMTLREKGRDMEPLEKLNLFFDNIKEQLNLEKSFFVNDDSWQIIYNHYQTEN